MKSLYIQLLVGFFFSLLIITLTKISSSTEIITFIRSNGLIAILALLAINASTACFTLARLCELESLIKKPYYFDPTKKLLRNGFLEQIVSVAVLVVLLAITPSTWWGDPAYWSISTLINTLALGCVVHVTYCTYDFAIAAIDSTMSSGEH